MTPIRKTDLKKNRVFSWLLLLHVIVLTITAVLLVVRKGDPTPSREKIIILPIDGVISTSAGSLAKGLTVEGITKAIYEWKDDDQIKAIVLQINSPGGSVGAVQEIYGALQEFRRKGKIVTASITDVAASGGYYLACASDIVFTHPGSLTGSIGVIMQLSNFQGLMSKIGVSVDSIKSGSMKDAGSPFRKLSPKERAHFQSVIMDAYGPFFMAVKEGRKLDDKSLKPLADGRIFTGRMAKENKLVDKFGGLREAIEEAKTRTGLSSSDPQIIRYEEGNPLERLVSILSKSPASILSPIKEGEIRLLYMIQ